MQTLRRIAVLLAVSFATLLSDDIESKFRKALAHHHYDEVIALVRQGFVYIDAPFDDGSSPLCLAPFDESAEGFDIALELVAHRASVDRMCMDELRQLHRAAEAGNLAIIDLLVRNGADVSPQSHPEHYTPLFVVLSYGNGCVAKALERQGATILPVSGRRPRLTGGSPRPWKRSGRLRSLQDPRRIYGARYRCSRFSKRTGNSRTIPSSRE